MPWCQFWVKTSGASGLHLVGIEPEYEFEEAHTWAIAIDRVLVERRPDLFSMDYTRSRRTEKDWTTTKSVMGEPRPLFTALDHCPEHRFRHPSPGRRSIQEISR